MTVVAVTGLTGFVGRNVARALASEGTRWRGLVRDQRKLAALDLPQGEIVAGSLEDTAALERLCEGTSAVIHCGGSIAALSRKDFFTTNVAGTSLLLAASLGMGVKRFVHVSSLAAREPQVSDYAASKRAGEEAVRKGAGSTSWAIVRPPVVYGPGDAATVPLMRSLARPIAFLPGSAATRLSVIHVEDLARAHILALDALTTAGLATRYNLGCGGQGYSVREVIETARRVTGHPIPEVVAPRRGGDPAVLVASAATAREKLGWNPSRTDLAGIVADAWEFAQQRAK
jgi:nucleoside-diphosphate-sugar epimerase